MNECVAWDSAGSRVSAARQACLVALGNHYGHPPSATTADVLAAVNTLLRVGFDLGAEFARSSLIPPPPGDPEVVSAAEALIRALRGG